MAGPRVSRREDYALLPEEQAPASVSLSGATAGAITPRPDSPGRRSSASSLPDSRPPPASTPRGRASAASPAASPAYPGRASRRSTRAEGSPASGRGRGGQGEAAAQPG